MPYLTPDTIPNAFVYKWIRIPNDLRLIGALTGALGQLGKDFRWEQFGAATPEETAEAMLDLLSRYLDWSGSLIGSMFSYPGLNPPDGCLPCDGEVYQRVDFPELYAYLAETVLIVDADHFTTPYFPNRVVVAAGDEYEPFGEFGTASHTLIEGEIPPHDHTYTPPVLNVDLESPGAPDVFGAGVGFSTVTGSTGGGEAHENRQPSIAFNWCIVAGRSLPSTPPPESFILFGTGEPNLPDLVTDTDDYWLGVRLQTTVPGNYTAIRFYKDASSSGTYRGQIWDDTNAIVAGADFTDTSSGWQQVDITPVHTDADTTFTIGVHFPTGEFRRRLHAFDSTYENYPFRIVGAGENGVYVLVSFGGGDNRPRFVFDNSDYGVSVVFVPD